MNNLKISSFIYTTDDIRLVRLNKADKEMLKDMGFSRLPLSLSRVEFLCVNKCYQGIGMKMILEDMRFSILNIRNALFIEDNGNHNTSST